MYALAIPTKNMTAKKFFYSFGVHYRFPKRIHADQGANFTSKLIFELSNVTRISKSQTTTYNPMGNVVYERFNRTLLNMRHPRIPIDLILGTERENEETSYTNFEENLKTSLQDSYNLYKNKP